MSAVRLDSADRPAAALVPARFSVEEFDLMLEAGILRGAGAGKIELHRGEILYVMPPNPPHDDVIRLLTRWAFQAQQQTATKYEVCVQLSMDCTEQASVPCPDLMLVKTQSYSRRRPRAEDTFLLVEVADSSLPYDLADKMQLYADAGVREYWVVDVPHRCLIVHSDPADGRYRSIRTYDQHQQAHSVTMSDVSLVPRELFR